jgi:hypothetical protein
MTTNLTTVSDALAKLTDIELHALIVATNEVPPPSRGWGSWDTERQPLLSEGVAAQAIPLRRMTLDPTLDSCLIGTARYDRLRHGQSLREPIPS